MENRFRRIGLISGILTFVICLIAGMYILLTIGFDNYDEGVYAGIGLYFIGKAFFVGPMLIITTLGNPLLSENENLH